MLHCGAWSSLCGGFSCCGAQARALGFSSFCTLGLVASQHVEIFPDQGLNLCPRHWHTDSYPLPPGKSHSSFSIVLSNDKTTVLVKDLLCRKPSPNPRSGEIRQRLVTVGNWRRKWLGFIPKSWGTEVAGGAYDRSSTLHGGTFMGTKTAHLSPLLGGHKAPHGGLALAGLLIAWLNCQVYSSLKGIQEESKRPTGQSQRRACSHLCGPLLPGLITAALDHGSLQKRDQAYEVETVQQNL